MSVLSVGGKSRTHIMGRKLGVCVVLSSLLASVLAAAEGARTNQGNMKLHPITFKNILTIAREMCRPGLTGMILK